MAKLVIEFSSVEYTTDVSPSRLKRMPRYVKSEWCLRELEEFIDKVEQNQPVDTGNKSRVFKVIKAPIERTQHPAKTQDMTGYEFFREDPSSGRLREFVRGFGANIDPEFWEKLYDLAQDICQLLETVKEQQDGPAPPSVTPSGRTIYLAQTTFEMNDNRDLLRRELEAYGHTVLPDQALPMRGPELETAVRNDLQACDLSIHFVGAEYGVVPEAAEHSIVKLQNDLAVERAAAPGFTHLLWLPPNLDPTDARQQTFIAGLLDGSMLARDSELLQTPIAELKATVHDRLTPREEDAAPDGDAAPAEGEDGPLIIYLICDEQDEEATEPLDNYLYEQGFEVKLPVFDGSEAEVAEAHRERLRRCDAALIYYGGGSEAWLDSKIRELLKAPGYGRDGKIPLTAVYVAGPEDRVKRRFRTREVDDVIKCLDGFAAAALESWVNKLGELRGGHAS